MRPKHVRTALECLSALHSLGVWSHLVPKLTGFSCSSAFACAVPSVWNALLVISSSFTWPIPDQKSLPSRMSPLFLLWPPKTWAYFYESTCQKVLHFLTFSTSSPLPQPHSKIYLSAGTLSLMSINKFLKKGLGHRFLIVIC